MAARQQAAFDPVLSLMRAGRPREDFVAVAAAVEATHAFDPLIVEIGCGGAWNADVLSTLLKRPVRYVGLDYAVTILAGAKRHSVARDFVAGDAASLPLRDGACDILVSGTVLMHVPEYAAAIRESRRVTRRWCVFHTVPVLQRRATTVLSKAAYGARVIEVIFNEPELLTLFQASGLRVTRVFENIPYNIEAVLGERTETRTYLCEVTGG